MTRIIVVGAGMGGLAAALFCARRGHDVVLVDRDGGPPAPAAGADDDVLGWKRPGVSQARQGHAFLALSTKVLREEAPDVLDRLTARGAVLVPLTRGSEDANVLSRRLVYEAVLRRAVQDEPGVTVLEKTEVRGLCTDPVASGMPVVVGVRLATGERLDADLVVNATGRRSAIGSWLAELDVSTPADTAQPCGFFYLTRHYRLHAGSTYPTTEVPLVAELDYATAIAFPGDNGTYQLSTTVASADPLRHRLRDPSAFERFLTAVPMAEPWLRAGTPTDDPQPMSRIENRWRRLVDGDVPVVGGMVLLADAAMQLNPTFGRGVSLAFQHAQHLARTVERVTGDRVGYVADFEEWTARHLGPWFSAQVDTDTARVRQLAAGVRGEEHPPATDMTSRFAHAMTVLRETDQEVRDASIRIYNLLMTPAELRADRVVVRRIVSFLSSHPEDHRTPGLSRTAFEHLVVGS